MTFAVTYQSADDPADAMQVIDVADPPPPAPGQIQVRVTAFPIHPGDLLAASNAPRNEDLLVAGHEATGVVTQTGPGTSRFSPGARVTFFPHVGAWRQIVNVDADIAVAVPDTVTEHVAAQMVANPLTALQLRRLAEQHTNVGYHGVVVNNAAASSVGRLFTAIANQHGIDTIGIVRSHERVHQLAQRFPEVPVISTSDNDWTNQVRSAAAGRPILAAFDPVGGTTATTLLSLLSAGGTLTLYGQLDPQPITLHASTMLPRGLTVRAMTISRWFDSVSAEQRAAELASVLAIAENYAPEFETTAIYSLDRLADAVAHVLRPGKLGTALIKP